MNKIYERKIKEVKFEQGEYEMFVNVKYDDSDNFEKLFSYYDDEISFTEDELIGLTEIEAYNLKHDKDLYYLQHDIL